MEDNKERLKRMPEFDESSVKAFCEKGPTDLTNMFKHTRPLTASEMAEIELSFQKFRSQPVAVPVPYPLELHPAKIDYIPRPPQTLTREEVDALIERKNNGK